MRLSDELIAFVKRKEGFANKAYPDGKGYSIGYGHYSEKNHYTPETQISESAAELYLKADLHDAAEKLIEIFPRFGKLDQGKRDALISLVFNWGIANFKKSKLFKHLKAKEYECAAKEFLDITKSNGKILPGLVTRRKEEAEIFLNGWKKEYIEYI